MTTKPKDESKDETVSSETPQGRAKLAVIPVVQSALVIESFAVSGKADVGDLVAELRKKGVRVHKPLHFAQMQLYLWAFRIERAYYTIYG